MEPEVTYAHLRFPKDSDVTYAQVKLPPAVQEKRARQQDLVRTTVTTPGTTPASSSARTTSLRALGLLSGVLLVTVITLAVYSTRYSTQLQRKIVEVGEWSTNASLMSKSLMQISKQLENTKKNVTQLLLSHEEITRQNARLSDSLHSTNRSLRELLMQRRQADEQSERSWRGLQGWNQFQCSREQMPVIRCCSCQQGWILQNMRCYYFSTDIQTWQQSKDKCGSLQSQLVSINNQEEQVFIMSMIKYEINKYWMGYSDSVKENEWLWADGSSSDLSFWKPGQPDNHWDEHCATTEKISWSLRSWNDDNCWKYYRYICEKAADQKLFRVTGLD